MKKPPKRYNPPLIKRNRGTKMEWARYLTNRTTVQRAEYCREMRGCTFFGYKPVSPITAFRSPLHEIF